jgi:exodeoxyribonuclease III
MSRERQEQESLFAVAGKPTARDLLGVITWNLQHAAADRARRQAAWLAAHDHADIVVLTEVPGSRTADILVEALVARGYEVCLADGDGADYRVIVGSRTGSLTVAAGLPSTCLPHRLVAVRVDTPGRMPLSVVGLYVPSRGPQAKRNVAKREFQDSVGCLLPRLTTYLGPDAPIVIGGDLNVVEPGHIPHHGVFGVWEYDFYRAFIQVGFVDCFRHLNHHALDHSWFGRSGAGYRFDHLFITGEHAGLVAECAYLHEARTGGLSDHAAMSVLLRSDPDWQPGSA